jgi:cyclic beta-1,2-glucan synthetase
VDLARRHHADAVDASEKRKTWAVDMLALERRSRGFAAEMNFTFLYNPDRELFSIGFNVPVGRLDSSHYDLLASEACIASFLAVARGEVPRKHWFQLGRLATRTAGDIGLVSWGGTMFEYLMPRLLLPVPPGVLLDQAQKSAVRRQIQFGGECNLPWGVSESGFFVFDAAQVYQYQSFGVPGLGLKRGLDRDRVIAPYATLLAVDVAPVSALANLARISNEGGEGAFGYFEAVDYTPSRLPEGWQNQVVRSYMAHHQAMGLLAIVNKLTDGVMRRRLRVEPAVRAAELLLAERIPYEAPGIEPQDTGAETSLRLTTTDAHVRRRITTPDTPAPRPHLLSNGRYSVMVTNSGAGYSRCGDLDVTRWRADATADDTGTFIYVRDKDWGGVWSAGFQPVRRRSEVYEVTYSLDKADFRRIDDGVETLTEITVAADQDVEVRRVTLTNLGDRPREMDIVSYAEIVLAPHAADIAHPAFGKLFVETEWLPEHSAIICRRRPRTPDQAPIWAVHVVASDSPGDVRFETDRAKFLGRRRNASHPRGVERATRGATGPVLDPVVAICRSVSLGPGEKVAVAFTTGVAVSRESALALADLYNATHAVTRVFELAWARARIELQHTQLRAEDVHLFQRLAGHLLFPTGGMRAGEDILAANKLGQSALWRFGISGDLPIAVLYLHSSAGMGHLRQLLQGHTIWQARGLRVDLVVLLGNAGGYLDELHTEAMNLVRSAGLGEQIDKPGGVFVRKSSQMSAEDQTLLLSVARLLIDDRSGPLATQANAPAAPRPLPARRTARSVAPKFGTTQRPAEITFWNGYGGFIEGGHEYLIGGDADDRPTPTPWINVVANPAAGFLVSDSGGGFTWAGNSQSNRLTPWSNDPVSDPAGEVIYVQDDASGAAWCPTAGPIRNGGGVQVRHGQGYSIFERVVNEVHHELTVFMPVADPVKVSLLKLRNTAAKPQRFNLLYYVEWVLGTQREAMSSHVITEVDAPTGALFARNPYHPEIGSHVAFIDISVRPRSVSGDRVECLGRNGSLASPAALDRVSLSGRVGAGLDPCGAVRASILLGPGQEETVVFLLGQAADANAARGLVKRYVDRTAAAAACAAVVEMWDRICGNVQVQTPDPAFDFLINRWLIYQTLSCRVWGRSAFYQSGGAYGFRDQLQDVMALLHAAPGEARAQLLRAGRHQFREGDVLHWWHEPMGNGVRTRFSDDFLWLPYAVCHYVRATGDLNVCDVMLPYIEAPLLRDDQHEAYIVPTVSEYAETLYDHCVKAIDNGWKLGAHGLPLMGCGDWNDGMSTVGIGGKGESVWVAWFQIVCLNEFADLADRRGDNDRGSAYRERASELRDAVERHGHDGGWYRRAYFDDGTPLGSAQNDECRIDSLTQSWAVIAGAADRERSTQAMDAVLENLVRRDDRLILLFEPPFDTGPLQPGYIKGYVPGVRENGGQYTHAACWVVKALADLGRADEAFEAFSLLDPIRSTLSSHAVDRYRGEPYVLAGDVYSCPQHVGRAGWTWYTGSSAWLYRVGMEDILGLRRVGDRLRFEPCVPAAWPGFRVRYRFGASVYDIEVKIARPAGPNPTRIVLDGKEQDHPAIQLIDDKREHAVLVTFGTAEAKRVGGIRQVEATH